MSQCFQPFYVRKQKRLVPCGQCWFCKSKLRAEWDFRLTAESLYSRASWWLTLTYSPEFIPINKSGYFDFNQAHLTKFIKDLRNDGFVFSYYLISEYGGKFCRPHYHLFMFVKNSKPIIYVKKRWPYGRLQIDPATPADIHYTSKFHVMPKDRVYPDSSPPSQRCSNNLGIEWLSDHFYSCNPKFIRLGRNSYPFPRYYSKLLGFTGDSFTYDIFDLPPEKLQQQLLYLQDISHKKLDSYKNHSNYVNFH